MFINISTDQVYITVQQKEFFLDRDDIEKKFPRHLINLANTYDFTDIVVINGPGGFTNLRVGALCLNMLNKLFKERFSIYNIDKIKLYNYFVKENILPSHGILYIGQKKNIWSYDFKKKQYIQDKKDNILSKYTSEKYFLDLVYDDSYFNLPTLKITGTGGTISIFHKGEEHTVEIKTLINKPEKYIQANYFIQPILGKQGQ